jgi:hypothetical protein
MLIVEGMRVEPRMFESRLSRWAGLFAARRCGWVDWWWTVGLSRGWEISAVERRGEEQQRGRKRNGEGRRWMDVITTNFLQEKQRIGGECEGGRK